jgi:23S rRNA U2552 (ribose-2'-O)-methylase RlmE/FtsJ
LDLGCWPGGWLQVASATVGPKGKVVGVDKAAIDPPLEIPNCESVVGDLEDPKLCEQVLPLLGGLAGLILCDAAPKLTGVRAVDRANEERLLEAVALPRRSSPRLPARVQLSGISSLRDTVGLKTRLKRHPSQK